MTLPFHHETPETEEDCLEMTDNWSKGKEAMTSSKRLSLKTAAEGPPGFSRARCLAGMRQEAQGLLSWPSALLCSSGWHSQWAKGRAWAGS